MLRNVASCILFCFLIVILSACGSPEEQSARFIEKGKELYSSGKYATARIEFKNALQIDQESALAFHNLGLTELKLENFRAAYGAFSKAVEYDPDNLDAHLELGRLLFGARQIEQAAEKSELILAAAPGKIEAIILKASVLQAKNQPDECVALLADLVTIDLKHPQAFMVLAACYSQANKEDKIGETLKKGMNANPDDVALRLMMARYEARHKRLDEAATQVRKAIEIQPENTDLVFQLAGLYWAFAEKDQGIAVIRELLESKQEDESIYLQAAGLFSGEQDKSISKELLREGLAKFPESFKLRFALSDLYVNAKQIDRGFAMLHDSLDLSADPNDPNIILTRLAMAKLYLLTNQLREAGENLQEVLNRSPKNVEARYLNGQLLLWDGKNDEAVAEFRTVIAEKPQFIPGYLLLSRAHIANNQPELAMNVLKKALDINPDALDIHRPMAALYVRMKDYDAAEGSLRSILTANPDDLRTIMELGDLFMMSGEFAKAEQKYKEIIEKAPLHPLAYLKAGRLHIQQNNWQAAEEVIKKGFTLNPDTPALLSALIEIYLHQGKEDAAIAAGKEEVSRRPDSPIGYTLLGQIYANLQRYQDAEEMLKKAIELEPAWQTPYNSLVQLYIQQGKQEQAITELEAMKLAAPDNLTTYLSLAILYERTGQYDKARTSYEQLIEKKPDSWVAANNLAFFLSQHSRNQEDLDKALMLAKEANNLRPDNEFVLDTLGMVHFRRGEYDKAMSFLDKALEKSPDKAVINYHAALILHKIGRVNDACEKLDKALFGDDDFPERDKAAKMQKDLCL